MRNSAMGRAIRTRTAPCPGETVSYSCSQAASAKRADLCANSGLIERSRRAA